MIIAKDFYLLRAPALPISFLQQFDGLPFAHLEEKLKVVFTDPYLQEAIYIASPELYQEFQKWFHGNERDEKDVPKLLFSLFRYLLRMSTRCTPYGLFAGCALGTPGTSTHILLAHRHQHKKHCRLDMNYVAELAAAISQLPHVQSRLLYYPNNSLYKMAGKYRYAEYTVKNKFRAYHLTEVACSDYLEAVINAAGQGATLDALANTIVRADVSSEEAKDFVLELVQNQILVSELEPAITGEEFFTRLIKKLAAIDNETGILEKLTCIQHLLRDQATGTGKYLQTHALVKELLPDTSSKDLVQTDLFLAAQHNTICSTAITDIQTQLEKLWSLSRLYDTTDLQSFRRAFKERYDEQEVPLVAALDTETGIGYAGNNGSESGHAPLVDDIADHKAIEAKSVTWSKTHDFQLKRLRACVHNKAAEILLTDEDLDQLKETATPAIPDSLYVMGSLLATSAAAVDAGDYRFELNGSGGPSAATLLGRFCHGDEELTAKVKECLREEERNNPDVVYAEVVHLPEARTGNVLLRPQLRSYEIVYLGNGSTPQSHQIPLTDLMVCVQNNMVVLRSKKLNKRVIPRLSSAHNFSSGSLPAYKFLGDLQFQQLHSAVSWQWNLLNEEPFLPRVRYGKIILAKCTWILHKKDYPELAEKKANTNYPELVKKIRQELRLPQYVTIVEGDNELLIDLNSGPCQHILAQTLVKSERVVIQEFLRTEDKCFVEGEGGRYTNEIIVPLKRSIPATQDDKFNGHLMKRIITPGRLHNGKDCIPQRSFLPGSEWLYAKIYCGTRSAERILKEIIKPLTCGLIAEHKIDKWFFLRYADPDPHIRIRFHHVKDGFWKEIMEALHAAMDKGAGKELAGKIQLDTYEREIERYGSSSIELTEDIFYYDSEAVVNCIDLLEGEEGETYRWLLAVRGVHMLLNDFEYDLSAKAALLKKLQQNFLSEFGGGKTLTNQLNDKYREHMHAIRSFLDERNDRDNEIEEAIALFTTRSARCKETIRKIKMVGKADPATPGFDALVPSYIHMFLNRMFLSSQRKHELVTCHFLSRYYESMTAIQKQQLAQKV